MLFNSIEFAIFLPIIFVIYWFVVNRNLKVQNLLLLLSSYIFYGWWDWRFLSLIIFSSIIDFTVGLQLGRAKKELNRKWLLFISIFINIGLLGFFKYYNFFIESFIDAFTAFGHSPNIHTLRIILPVGISFYTFQTLSYSIDVYRRKLEPSYDFISFFAFVSFFPQLVAGPIERATNLLPQFYKKRQFNLEQSIDGLRQMLWGLFKKVVVADNLCKIVDPIYNNPDEMSSLVLILGLALFSVQIYTDFSGYSDIAIGISRLLGFNLKINFRYPLFARSIGERWRNWHISLSTWFRDYIYIPMGGSRGSNLNKFKNTLILFTISGFWHGANWTFICWGLLNGLYFAPSMLRGRNRRHLEPISKSKIFPSFKEFTQIFTTFWLIATTYIFFRADNIQHSKQYFLSILSNTEIRESFRFIENNLEDFLKAMFFTSILFLVEWINRDKPHGLHGVFEMKPIVVRWGLYLAITFSILIYGGEQAPFVYFQF
ncbi:MBOAT family O-acyltransferase [Plebeiibacterium sediminum]|uniref:MBOAT family protein n=1 Tax=Plebeiibacterium sediminum TaxID=2992112 RepID=A0AAE3M355_9BACT|nr:MBOAT family O-acyltransferase [Plebeiobacterium sediminum]MCW3786233.1 MBOAT family protein [Plebeiobacterium sediminum]